MIRFPFVFMVFWLALPAPAAADNGAPKPQFGPFYSGQLLVAAKTMVDPRFAQTVIYLADHDRKGAFGLVLTRPLLQGSAVDFMRGLKMEAAPDADPAIRISLYSGGPVEPGAGFVLHTNEYKTEGTSMARGAVAVTASLKAVRDISMGKGPRRHAVFLGYAGWGPGQLKGELQRGDWLIAPYDEAVVFDDAFKTKYDRAKALVGVPM
ncbi:MAG: YqgE/AlgH family protein [Rhodospirillaceae bacterium]